MKKELSLFIASVMMLLVFTPVMENAQAADNEDLGNSEQQEAVQLEKELRENDITELDIVTGLDEQLSSTPAYNEQTTVQAQGVKSKTAAYGAKQMITMLENTGKYAWNSSVKEYVDKLPISTASKSTLEKYLGYQFVMETLNVVINFQGDITEALSLQMQNAGLPSWLSGIAARTLVFLLL
ncbi:hypothetical protein [Halobacillus sp. A5]|uniref:hypothetical protein n=1 Tax=Halobacillus sp. A5 TaxID=2880263 RepID=UPI0020A6B56D|nr:hypothetical protein [Halobacillus sp. A5]MCP3027888.1 hypothetical protein [Halobacillus sp. A5]